MISSQQHLVTGLLAVGMLFVAGCGKKSETTVAKQGSRQPVFPVEVMRVDAHSHELVVTAPGVVDAFEHVQVTARVSGVVDKVTFVEGQDVKLGQILAYIDSRRYALGVSTARAALEKSQATAADSQAALDRRQNASATNPGLIPGEELESFQTKRRTAQADVSQAIEGLKLAQLNLDDSNVKASTAGIIQTRSVQTGQYVQAGTVIATLLRRDPLLLHFNVTTAEAPRLKVGMPVEFTLKESQHSYAAKITLVTGAADDESRLVPITAQIAPEHQFWLRPGTFAQVQIKLTSTRQFPMIPQSAARPSDHGFLAFVVVGDVAHEHVLQLGMNTTDGFVEVETGLEASSLLVTRGVEALADGSKVRVVTDAPKAPTATKPQVSAGSASADASGQPEPKQHRHLARSDAGNGAFKGVP
jgi:RND family efflux transporter MFP subunit